MAFMEEFLKTNPFYAAGKKAEYKAGTNKPVAGNGNPNVAAKIAQGRNANAVSSITRVARKPR